MISGDWILWNVSAVCERTKTSWQTGNLKMNEDLENPSRTCFVCREILGRRYSDCWVWRIEKLDASEKYARRLNAKEVMITQRDEEFVFPAADGSAKLSGRNCKFQEPTLRRESIVRRENFNGESHGDREEFQPEETKRWRRNQQGFFWAHAEARKAFHLSPSCWTEKFNSTCREKNHSLFHQIYIIERNSSEKKYHMRRENWRSQNIWGKNKFNCIWYCSERMEFCALLQLCASSSLNSPLKVKASTCCLVSRKPQKTGEYKTLKWEPGKKEVWTPNVVLISELRESRVTYGSEDSGDLSLRDACVGKPRRTNKISFTPSNVDSRWKGDDGKGMKGSKKQKIRKVIICCIDGHSPHLKVRVHPEECYEGNLKCGHKYEYIPENVRKSYFKCGNYEAHMKELYTNFQRSRNKVRIFKWVQSLTKWLTGVINEKLREWIQNHPPVQITS